MIKKESAEKAVLYTLFVALALLWGLSFFGTKVALVSLSPVEVLAVRWLMSFVLFAVMIAVGIIKIDYKGKPNKYLFLAVMVQPCCYAFFEAWGIELTTSSESSIFIAVIPLMVVLESFLLFKNKVSKKTGIGICIGFSGIVTSIIFAPDFSTGGKFAGYVFLIIAVITGAFYTILSNRLSKFYSPMEITFALAAAGGIFFNLLSMAQGNGFRAYQMLFSGGKIMWALIYLGVGCSFCAYLIFNYTLSKLKAELAACIQTNSITVVGVIAGIVWGGDSWGWYTIAGMVMTIIGIVISSADVK